MILVDSHAHLDYLERGGADCDAIMANAEREGLSWLVNPMVEPGTFADVLNLANRFPRIFAAVAVHPSDIQNIKHPLPHWGRGQGEGDQDATPESWRSQVEEVLDHPKVIAIGETGLDYYRNRSHADLQQQFFRDFLAIGRERNLPVIVHDREAHEDIRRIIGEFSGVRGVMHCFSGDIEFAHSMIKQGFYISFAGNITFKNALNLHETAKTIPLEWMLIETDSPFLSPVPFRGKENEPARVRLVAEKIAELRRIPLEIVAEVTSENARKLFQPCL